MRSRGCGRCGPVREEARCMTSNDADTRLRLLYEETGRVAAVFFEWRHKVILLCSAVLTLALGAVSWMFNARLSGVAMAIPLLFGSFVAAACRRFDRRNGQILDALGAIAARSSKRGRKHLLSRPVENAPPPRDQPRALDSPSRANTSASRAADTGGRTPRTQARRHRPPTPPALNPHHRQTPASTSSLRKP